jgi:hypothetical protein
LLFFWVLLLVGCGGGGSGLNPSPNPTSLPDFVVDDFERPSLGGNWTIYIGDVAIINNSDLGMRSQSGPLFGLGIVAWGATVFSANQFSEGEISRDVDANSLYQVFVRRRVSDGLRYGFHWQPGTSGGEWALKRDGVTAAQVLVAVSAAKPLPGDRIRIEVRGNLLQGFHNGVKVIEVTDSVLTEAGQPGVAMNTSQVTLFPSSFFKSWTGGSLN